MADSGFSEDGSKAQFFVVQAVDGKTIDNTLIEDAATSQPVTEKVRSTP